uniref:Uncharacterized protein n=1 Tax=Populus trichocarpa TaxID=3694 RepID=A0A3N7FS50_POPTR
MNKYNATITQINTKIFYVENPMREKPRDRSPPKNFHYHK